MNIEKLLKGLAKAITGEKVFIGKVDVALVEELGRLREEHRAEHQEIEDEVKAFIQKIREQHQPSCDRHAAAKEAVWNSIYDAADIPENEREKEYEVNPNGSLFRVDRKIIEEEEVEKTIH